ncbi:Lhr family helicase [Streptomyces albidoflavus]
MGGQRLAPRQGRLGLPLPRGQRPAPAAAPAPAGADAAAPGGAGRARRRVRPLLPPDRGPGPGHPSHRLRPGPGRCRLGAGLVGPAHQRHGCPAPRPPRLGPHRRVHGAPGAPSVPRGRFGALAAAPRPASRTGPPTVAGRWSLLPPPEPDPTLRAHALARALLDRHGVVTRGAVAAEGVEGGFSAVYRVLSAFEDSGQARRGYVVEGLGAAQFAMDGAVDRLRASATAAEREAGGAPRQALVLAAADPANAYGAALPWPEPPTGAGHKPGRKAGAMVVLVDGELAVYMERGGKTLLAWPSTTPDDPSAPDPRLEGAAHALAGSAAGGSLGTVTVERINGEPALTSPVGTYLENAGFHATPRGLRLRGGR